MKFSGNILIICYIKSICIPQYWWSLRHVRRFQRNKSTNFLSLFIIHLIFKSFVLLKVTAGYENCGQNSTCNCAVYLKKRRSLVFMDFCTASSSKSPTSEFYTVSSGKVSHEITEKDIKPLPKCDIILPGQENDEAVWKSIKPVQSFFKCARIQGKNNFETYVVSIFKKK